ncbi:LPS export ABC transporter ATP-binding protein [Xanthobacter sp. KR7-225]|uniref:LPS export ABC transporter ATP-binding protein n=1 Tax=Xanthobacter sp. KR7-225 TaxID=3156613 RepID=UPI0032B34F50
MNVLSIFGRGGGKRRTSTIKPRKPVDDRADLAALEQALYDEAATDAAGYEPRAQDPGVYDPRAHGAGADHDGASDAQDYRDQDYAYDYEDQDYADRDFDPGADGGRRDGPYEGHWQEPRALTYAGAHGRRGPVTEADMQDALAAYGLAKSYGGRQVVRDVSMNVRRGEAVGLLGPNGAGKTTCFYMVTGLVKADAGRIELDGHDVTPMPMYRRARLGIGYLPQEASIFRGLTVEGNIMGVLEVTEPDRRKRHDEMEALLEEFKITHVRKSPAIALSGGERRRVEIARALASRPSFMLLDEPFAGIDPIAVGDIQALVRHLTSRGIGVLITDHNVRETLGLIDRAYIIHSGTVLMEGDPEAIVSSPDVRRLYLGEEFRL